eukprot:3952298-Amphidinium_carterae.1
MCVNYVCWSCGLELLSLLALQRRLGLALSHYSLCATCQLQRFTVKPSQSSEAYSSDKPLPATVFIAAAKTNSRSPFSSLFGTKAEGVVYSRTFRPCRPDEKYCSKTHGSNKDR